MEVVTKTIVKARRDSANTSVQIGLKDFSSKAEFLYYNNKSLTCDIITLVMGRYCIRRSEFVNKTMKIYKESGLLVLLCTFVARHSVPCKIARR